MKMVHLKLQIFFVDFLCFKFSNSGFKAHFKKQTKYSNSRKTSFTGVTDIKDGKSVDEWLKHVL